MIFYHCDFLGGGVNLDPPMTYSRAIYLMLIMLDYCPLGIPFGSAYAKTTGDCPFSFIEGFLQFYLT